MFILMARIPALSRWKVKSYPGVLYDKLFIWSLNIVEAFSEQVTGVPWRPYSVLKITSYASQGIESDRIILETFFFCFNDDDCCGLDVAFV